MSSNGGWRNDDPTRAARVRWLAQDARFRLERPWRPTACGAFEATADVTDACGADVLREGARTPVTVRFGELADGLPPDLTARRPQAFDVRFGEGEGEWDLPGSSAPMAWTPDRSRPLASAANDNRADARGFWNAAASHPAMVHRLLWTFSDWSLPRSLRMMEGFSETAAAITGTSGKLRLARFHWRSRLGPQAMLSSEVQSLQAVAGDYLHRDLYETMLAGDAAVWFLGMQMFDQAFPGGCDGTRIVPEAAAPVRIVGRVTLEACTEPAAGEALVFNPDRRPLGVGPPPPGCAFGDPYEQPRLLWRSWTDSEQAHAIDAFAQAWSGLDSPTLQRRLLEALWPVDDGLARAVASRLGVSAPKLASRRRGRMPADDAPDPALSVQRRMRVSLESRIVGVLLADGSDAVQVRMTLDEIEQAGGYALLVARSPGALVMAGGEQMTPDSHLGATPAAAVDAVGVIVSAAQARSMARDPLVLGFLHDLYAQLKCVAFTPDAQELLSAAGLERSPGVVGLERLATAGARRYFDRETALPPTRL